jgi:hypothetical protein
MSDTSIIQDWISLSGSTNTIIQNESAWVETVNYQDGLYYTQVSAAGTSGSTLMLQSSPTKDDIFFDASAGGTPGSVATFILVNSSTGVLPLFFSRWSTAPSQALGRYLRWKLICGTNVTCTFRIWAVFNQAGFQGQ